MAVNGYSTVKESEEVAIDNKDDDNLSLFHLAFRFTKFYLYQRMHLFLSYTKIT